MKKEKIKFEDLKIKIITKNHKVNNFESYEKDLVDFLKQDAFENQKKLCSVTFLWFYQNKLVAYITLLNDKIDLIGDLKVYFKQKDIHYKSLPALKIGRMCVDNKFLKRGLGTQMIDFAIKVGLFTAAKWSGCRFITVDPKNKSLIPFYERFGFETLQLNKKIITLAVDLMFYLKRLT